MAWKGGKYDGEPPCFAPNPCARKKVVKYLTAGELRRCGYDIAKDIPDRARIKEDSLVVSACDMDYDEPTKMVRGQIQFVITEAFAWEENDGL